MTAAAANRLDRSSPPSPGPVRPFAFLPFERHQLDDGLVLFAAPKRDVPLTSFELLGPMGASLDPPGRSGLAALTAAMLDEGTTSKTSREIAAGAERIGGYLSTTTDWDSVSLATGVVSSRADVALRLLAEVVCEPTFPEDELERLRDRVLAEIRRRRVVPSALAAVQFARALYGDSPYGWPVIGTTDSVSSTSRAEIERFYREHLLSTPITLIAVGDFEVDELRDRARKALGRLANGALGPLPPPQDTEGGDAGVYLVDRPEAVQTELRLGHVGVERRHPDFTTLAVMSFLLGGKFTSRLNLNLRERHGFTYGIFSSFSRRRARGPFTVSSAVNTENVGAAIAEIRGELERLVAEPVTAEELEETKSYILGVFPYTVQSLEGISARLRDIAVHDLPLDHWQRYPAEVQAVTIEDVQLAARRHLDPDRLTVVAVGPETELRPQLEPFGEPAVWRPADEPEPCWAGSGRASRLDS